MHCLQSCAYYPAVSLRTPASLSWQRTESLQSCSHAIGTLGCS